MRVGIAVDSWKFDIFVKMLIEADYEFSDTKITEGVILLSIETENVNELSKLVAKANNACARSKMN